MKAKRKEFILDLHDQLSTQPKLQRAIIQEFPEAFTTGLREGDMEYSHMSQDNVEIWKEKGTADYYEVPSHRDFTNAYKISK